MLGNCKLGTTLVHVSSRYDEARSFTKEEFISKGGETHGWGQTTRPLGGGRMMLNMG